jgi:hypothetical protein
MPPLKINRLRVAIPITTHLNQIYLIGVAALFTTDRFPTRVEMQRSFAWANRGIAPEATLLAERKCGIWGTRFVCGTDSVQLHSRSGERQKDARSHRLELLIPFCGGTGCHIACSSNLTDMTHLKVTIQLDRKSRRDSAER